MNIPSLTAQTRPAVEFGHRHLAMPLIERIRQTAGKVGAALAEGRVNEAVALIAALKLAADDQERFTRELLAAAPVPPSGGSSRSRR